jgi:pilus assembly protein CpaB
MRRFPGGTWLLLAVAFALLASYLALGWLKRQAAAQRPRPAKAALVVVAKTKVGQATALGAAQLKLDTWHQENPPPGAFDTIDQVVGRVTATSLMPGELIMESKLAPKGTAPGITALLGPNKRAMTVKVDEASGVAGFLAPGDWVDVVVIVDKGEYDKDPLAKVLFQNLKVLGTGQKLENRPGDKPQIVPTVTLEVTPEEGERLALAAQEGRISLVLRGQGDQQMVETRGVDASRLFGRPAKSPSPVVAAASSAPPRRTVEVIRGIERQPVNF